MNLNTLTFGPVRGFDRRAQTLLLLSLASSAVYLFGQMWRPLPGSVLFKALSIAPLVALALLVPQHDRRNRILLATALAFSCLGDVLLGFDSVRLFTHGLSAFLMAHVIYLWLFVRNWRRPIRLSGFQSVLLVAVLMASLLLTRLLAPHLGALRLPVSIYVCAITVMTASAIIARFRRPWVWLGAVFFMASDSIIAIDRFIAPVAARDLLVWTLYYLGQYGIAIGFIHEQAGEE